MDAENYVVKPEKTRKKPEMNAALKNQPPHVIEVSPVPLQPVNEDGGTAAFILMILIGEPADPSQRDQIEEGCKYHYSNQHFELAVSEHFVCPQEVVDIAHDSNHSKGMSDFKLFYAQSKLIQLIHVGLCPVGLQVVEITWLQGVKRMPGVKQICLQEDEQEQAKVFRRLR